jgi:probable F420-dependent oxidoreductase
MRFWLPLMFEPIDQFHEVARLAEEVGFEGIALADHIAVPEGFQSVHPSGENPFTPESLFPDPMVSMASMAAVTTRLRFMPYVYVLSLRDPFSVAKQLGTAAMFSNHRTSLGVGVGWLTEEIALLGHDPRQRGRRVDEMLSIVRDFLDDGWCEFHGEHFDVPKSSMFPVPDRPVPIWIGGRSPAALRRAARNDGWLGMNYDPDEIPGLLDGLAKARADEGSDTRGDFEVMVIANAAPSLDLFRSLADQGVTSTMGLPWAPGDPAFASLEAKRPALEQFAETFVQPLAD